MIKAAGRSEFSSEDPFELVGSYISRFGMSTENKKGAVPVEPPLKDKAPKMPLFSSVPTNPKVPQPGRKDARTSKRLPNKVKQCFESSRCFGNFFSGV